MPPESSLSAVPAWLDLANERLWCGTQARVLRPKTFALLRYLVEHPGQLLSKASLLEALWPETAVSEVVLSVCIRELRQALGDDAKMPRFIETVHRRGYRFIGHLPTVHPSAPHMASATPPPLFVGRAQELDALHRGLGTALTGVRQILFVTGEAGQGKTTLVDAFLTAVAGQGPLWIGRGQCLEHYGAGEAYLPVLEALERLCRGPGGQDVVALLVQQAPTWVVQMPGLVSPAELEGLQRRVLGTTRERMLRELAEALNVLTAARPLVLVLEDLHWSDYSTLDALAALARRREPARLLLLGTYRPPDALQRGHPLHTVQHELHMHGQCAELPLPLLPEAAVADYLAVRFPDAQLPAGLAHLVHQRTEGNPLFMVQVVEDWMRRGWFTQVDGRWTLRVGLAALAVTVPDGLWQMLEQQLDRLSPIDQRVLEVGSAAGATFSAAAGAAGLAYEVLQVEECCAGLARRRQWLEACGEQVWPDGTVAGSYRFTHALYQEVAYTRLTASRRVDAHRRIGTRVEAGYGTQGGNIAAELAMHFERGHNYQRAVPYLQQAGENAIRRCANQEAISYIRRGFSLLTRCADTPENQQHELGLQLALGYVLLITRGFADREVVQAFRRARELCHDIADPVRLRGTLTGSFVVHQTRAEHQQAREIGVQLLQLAEHTKHARMLLFAHETLGQNCYFLGEFAASREHCEQGIRLSVSHKHPQFDPGVLCASQAALTLWYLGYPDQARQRSREALALAHTLSDPHSLAIGLWHATTLQLFCRDVPATQACAAATIALTSEHGFPFWHRHGKIWQGWALAMQGQSTEGIAQMQQELAAWRGMGVRVWVPTCLGLLAEAHGGVGQAAKGLCLLAEAHREIAETHERFYAAELYRLKGELLLAQAGTKAQGTRCAEAESCFQQALAAARHQRATALELRAAMSLGRLWQQQGKRMEAHALLAPIYGWFTEGFDIADLQEAKALLEELRGYH